MTRGTGGIAMAHPDPDKATGGQSDPQGTGRKGATPPGPGNARPGAKPPAQPTIQPAGFGWSVFSYMIGGMILYGGIGWLVGRWTNLPVLFPVGMIVGLGLAIALIIFRVTRS
jgi:ATP synthase protein I